ncbi:MAG TPA: hypothetical protein VMG38_06810 [Trebonia sp.]|nr:hypothetical protein [Trebonia sp.]
MPDGTGTQPPGEDDLDRMLRELSERMASEAKRRAKADKKQARKQARTQPAPSAGAGWRGGYSGDEAADEQRRQDRRTRRHRALGTSVTVAILVLAGGGVAVYQHLSQTTAGGPNDAQVVTNGPKPTSSETAAPIAPSLSGPPADPFAGTPAQAWADGAAGIVVPKATAAGPFSASQVALAYQTVRKLLIAQNLDHTTLLGGSPTAFANLLVPSQRSQFVAGLDKTGLKSGRVQSTRAWLASFAPGTAALIGGVIKVHGTMSARASTEDGNPVLDIDVNYRIVYPVEPPRAPQDWMRIVGQDIGSIEFGNWQGGGGAFEPWVLTNLAEAGNRCDASDGFIHPDYPTSTPDKIQPSGPTVNPYDLKDVPTGKSCQPTSGT